MEEKKVVEKKDIDFNMKKIDSLDRTMQIDAVYWKPLSEWSPINGDWIIYNGWFSSWYGFVAGIDSNNNIIIRFDGLPLLLVTSTKEKYKNIHPNKIRFSRGNKFSIIRVVPKLSLPLWFLG